MGYKLEKNKSTKKVSCWKVKHFCYYHFFRYWNLGLLPTFDSFTLLLFLSYFFQVMYLRQRLRWQSVFPLFIRFSLTFPVFCFVLLFRKACCLQIFISLQTVGWFPSGGFLLVAVHHPVLQILTPFSDQKSHFPHSFSDAPPKFHIRASDLEDSQHIFP